MVRKAPSFTTTFYEMVNLKFFIGLQLLFSELFNA